MSEQKTGKKRKAPAEKLRQEGRTEMNKARRAKRRESWARRRAALKTSRPRARGRSFEWNESLREDAARECNAERTVRMVEDEARVVLTPACVGSIKRRLGLPTQWRPR